MKLFLIGLLAILSTSTFAECVPTQDGSAGRICYDELISVENSETLVTNLSYNGHRLKANKSNREFVCQNILNTHPGSKNIKSKTYSSYNSRNSVIKTSFGSRLNFLWATSCKN